MRHLDTEKLMEFMDDRVSDENKAAIEHHLSQCDECLGLKQELEILVLQLQADASFEPPAELVEWGVSLFQPMLRPLNGGKLRKIIAALVFDTFDQPLQAGVRGISAP